MISIQQEIRTGERLQRLQEQTLLEQTMLCYQQAIEDAKQNAIDFGAITAPYQASLDGILQSLAQEVLSDAHAEQLRARLQTAFRSYKEKAGQQLSRLRKDLEQTATSLSAVLKSLEYDDPALSLRAQVKQLDELQKIDDIQQLKASLQAALGELENSLNEMEKRDRLIISDLQAEITTLHNRVAVLAVQSEGPRSLRLILDDRLSGEPFTLLVVRIAGFARVKTMHGEPCANAVMTEAQNRLKAAIEQLLAVGLWDERTIGAVTAAGVKASDLTLAANTALTGKYQIQEVGEVMLQASAGVLAWRPQDDRTRFLSRLQDLVQVLA
jgi:GGDEF domain-containing protein